MSDDQIKPPKTVKTYTINAAAGTVESNGAADHKRAMEALKMMQLLIKEQNQGGGRRVVNPDNTPTPEPDPMQPASPQPVRVVSKYTLKETLKKFGSMKKLDAKTLESYQTTVDEFDKFLKTQKRLHQIDVDHVVNFREHLGEHVGNAPRTIDKKVGTLKAIFNFAIEQRYVSHNPAAIKNLLSKKQKNSGGYAVFEAAEIARIYKSQAFIDELQKDPDFYYCCLLALLTGLRHDEATQLLREQIQITKSGIYFVRIRQGKTNAAARSVPLPDDFMQHGFLAFINTKQPGDKIFKYVPGNALGKKFKRLIDKVGITRQKVVFHSLRKFLNNQLMHNKMPIEARSQMLGHELDTVNVAVYSTDYNVDELHLLTANTIAEIIPLTPI
jgi:integrase